MKKIVFSLCLVFVLLIMGCSNLTKTKVSMLGTEALTKESTVNVNEVVSETESEYPQNDFVNALEDIKNVHPGTAGCSIKVLIAAARFLNACKLKLPLDMLTNLWISAQNNENLSDINESFSYVLENIDNLDTDDSKKILKDNGMENEYIGPWDDSIKNVAKYILGIVIDNTKK